MKEGRNEPPLPVLVGKKKAKPDFTRALRKSANEDKISLLPVLRDNVVLIPAVISLAFFAGFRGASPNNHVEYWIVSIALPIVCAVTLYTWVASWARQDYTMRRKRIRADAMLVSVAAIILACIAYYQIGINIPSRNLVINTITICFFANPIVAYVGYQLSKKMAPLI